MSNGTADRIKTTIAMDRRAWTAAKMRAVAAGKPVGNWLEDLIRTTDDGTLARVEGGCAG